MKVKEIVAESEEEKIRECLKGERYLVVMDDMWSKKAWDDVKMLFPDNNNGSRIVLTTRLPDVAAYANPSGPIHAMRFLDENESWHLLRQRVFGRESCPIELEEIGKKIVTRCGGLPLSIVIVAGVLFSIGLYQMFWEQIAENDGELETILCLSYTHLPHHLRACFLYMGAFPEDYEINVSKLIKLWAGERFVQPPKGRNLEESAKEFFDDLVDRSLVLVTSRKYDGRIKSCSLHDMVRDFCIRQAQQEKLLLPVMDYLPSPILRKHFLPRVLKNHRRLSLTSHDLNVKDSVDGSHIRSIICIKQKGYKSVGSVDKFISLRVLHVLGGDDDWDWEPGQVFNLIHLTYLATHIPTRIVPPTISKLQNLETLIIYRYDVCLPVEIWRLRQLRHLISFSFHHLLSPEGQDLPLEGLQTLSMAKNFVCSERILKMIPNVKVLGICYSEEMSYMGYHLSDLKHLRRLEKLKLQMYSDTSYGASLNYGFPWGLRRLTLSGLRIPWSDMTVVGSLPLLQVLKLRNYACDGDLWETNEGEFRSLVVLLIDGSNLREWITENSHFPRLRHLSIYRCPYLSEIPSDIGDIPTGESIEVDDQNTALLESVKRIKLEQEEYENDLFRVHVKRY